MPKSNFFTGQPIFNQLLSLIPRSTVNRLARRYKLDRYCKKFRTYDHLVTMLYSTFHQCSSLREVITGMQASANRLRHLGVECSPRRSTLSDANKRRDPAFFQDLYHSLYDRHYGSLPDSLRGKKLADRLFIVDSSLIRLFSTVLKMSSSYCCNGKKKGGIKAHMLVRSKDNVPCFVRLTEGTKGDGTFLPELSLPTGSIVVMDKGYRSFKQFIRWTEDQITWVTRLYATTVYKAIEELPVTEAQKDKGVKSDTIINMGSLERKRKSCIQKARLIVFYDKETNKEFQFITNSMTLAPVTIAEIYKKRWQIELLFKRIKQNFQLYSFLGDNEKAISTQVWCALIADLLVKIVKDKVDRKKKWSMANLTSLLRIHLGTYIDIRQFLCHPDKSLLNYIDPTPKNQLNLFSTRIRGA